MVFIYVREYLCLGCGLCYKVCPVHAIWFCWNHVMIDAQTCINCGRCIEVCSRGAIGYSYQSMGESKCYLEEPY